MSLVTRGLGGPNLVTFGLGEQLGLFFTQGIEGALAMSGILSTIYTAGEPQLGRHYRGILGTFYQHRGKG